VLFAVLSAPLFGTPSSGADGGSTTRTSLCFRALGLGGDGGISCESLEVSARQRRFSKKAEDEFALSTLKHSEDGLRCEKQGSAHFPYFFNT